MSEELPISDTCTSERKISGSGTASGGTSPVSLSTTGLKDSVPEELPILNTIGRENREMEASPSASLSLSSTTSNSMKIGPKEPQMCDTTDDENDERDPSGSIISSNVSPSLSTSTTSLMKSVQKEPPIRDPTADENSKRESVTAFSSANASPSPSPSLSTISTSLVKTVPPIRDTITSERKSGTSSSSASALPALSTTSLKQLVPKELPVSDTGISTEASGNTASPSLSITSLKDTVPEELPAGIIREGSGTASTSAVGSPFTTSLSKKTIAEQLHSDILAAEFLVSLFWSATNSFRHDSILRPFPSFFIEGGVGGEVAEGGHKDIDGLRQVLQSIPPLHKIASNEVTLSTQQTELLQWILNPKRFSVSWKELSSFTSLLQKADSHSASVSDQLSRKPKYIFELEYNEESESKFRSITGEHGIMYAFHGSSVENFYSIVHNGLLNLFNKVAAFGEGTYLSTELGVCLNWSSGGSLWPSSTLPHTASCVAMCEVVKHPSVMSRCQVGGEPNIQQKVPEKYFIVTNDEFIRVKYVFVYELQKPVVRSRGWLYQHKFVVVLVLYLVVLVCVGASQSKVLRRLFRKYYGYFLD